LLLTCEFSPSRPPPPRDEIRPGLRSISDRLAIIFYLADKNEVRIVHVIHPRRDVAAVFQDL
jgi:plasmid stabilization system protein ParE